MLGNFASGRRIEAVPQQETMQVPDALPGKRPCYVLQVNGDSMTGAGASAPGQCGHGSNAYAPDEVQVQGV